MMKRYIGFVIKNKDFKARVKKTGEVFHQNDTNHINKQYRCYITGKSPCNNKGTGHITAIYTKPNKLLTRKVSQMDRFEVVFEGLVNDEIKIKKYKSKLTKLQVVVADVFGPMLCGHFCVATETFNDDGLPHILEHVLFLGSEQYPYKGVLDRIATRCISDGTNAWTDSDHTCFTATTAGFEGFLNLLPVYLDHILYPTLLDAAYTTEVHHINGQGKDGGVVYSEMQGTENTDHAITEREMMRCLYPKGSGYRYEHGGILKNIRESTNNEKVRTYHKNMYRPENLCLIIQGMVNIKQLFNQLSVFEDIIISKGLKGDFQRPWQSPVSPLNDSIVKELSFPSDEEDEGIVVVAWRGPPVNDKYMVNACRIMLTYLTDSPVALLNQNFVEVEEPICGEIDYSVIENSETSFSIEFTSVSVKNLKQIKPKLMELLSQQSKPEKHMLDMKRMATVIHNMILDIMNHMEHDVFDQISSIIIDDFLYGNNAKDTESRLNVLKILHNLKNEPKEFWYGLMKYYMINKPSVTIISRPNKNLVKENEKYEDMRMRKRAEMIGKDGLIKMQQLLDDAVAENSKPVPEEILLKVKIPNISSLDSHKITTYHNNKEFSKFGASVNNNDVNKIPCLFQLDDISTAFVTMQVFVDGHLLEPSLIPYLPLFVETLFESPIIRNNVEVPYENVVEELNEDLIEHSSSLGMHGSRFECGEFSSLVNISIKVERSKFERGVLWLGEIMSGLVFNEARVTSIAKKMMSDLTLKKREADFVVESLDASTTFVKESVIHCSSILYQQSFLRELQFKKQVSKHLANLNKIKQNLFKLDNMYIHMRTNVAKLKNSLGTFKSIQSVWNQIFVPLMKPKNIATGVLKSHTGWAPVRDSTFIRPKLFQAASSIAGVGSTDSSYLIQTCACPKDFNHPDVPALMVFCNFITELEGPIWKLIRGKGLAYSFSLVPDLNEGLMQLRIMRSSDLFEAYNQAYTLIEGLVQNKISVTQLELESAKSQSMFDITHSMSTPSLLSNQMLAACLRGVQLSFNKNLLDKIQKVTLVELKHIIETYIIWLVDPMHSKLVITCPPRELTKLISKFQTLCKCKFDVLKNVNTFESE